MKIVVVPFNDTQHVIVEIDPDFVKRYGKADDGYFEPVNRQANQKGGLFGVIIVPASGNIADAVRHEAGHAAFHWVRVHGYVESEEEAVLIIQDEIVEGFNKLVKSKGRV